MTVSHLSETVPGSDPVTLLSGHIRALRWRYVINRILISFSIALSVDLLFDLAAATAYTLWEVKLWVPFLFETLFLILVSRELPGVSRERFTTMLDHRFNLKDRLYSFEWFSRGGRVPNRIRLAQALETLEAVDFDSLRRSMKVRVPVILLVALPMFGSLLYLTWNADYRPPGIATRVITSRIAPTPHPSVSTTIQADMEETRSAGVEPGMNSNRTDDPNELASLDEKNPGSSESAQLERPNVAVNPDDIQSPVDASDLGTGSSGAGGSAAGGRARVPESLESNLVSPTAAQPVPPNLAANAAYSFQELPDATRFLNLIPGQGSQSLARLDPEIISNFEEGIENLPDRYREALQTYYWELKQWSQKP